MNYYDATQLSDGSGWHYTRTNDGVTQAAGYCSPVIPCSLCTTGFGKEGCPECQGKGYTLREGEEHVHETAEEARECFRRYLLDGQREETYADWTGCRYKDCDTPTKKGLTTRTPLGHGHPLCDEHRTPEILEELTPGIGQITASY